ncbi:MAG TPA: zinc ribbon domain-containing protein [Oligoflexia bacterium]|nr:zinc ribbon domain-containing protein [Oligoflexia bacterium]
MPTYEYQCFACSHHFEVFQKISDKPIDVCPQCHANGGSVKRLLFAAPFHLKGSGWYKTDYASSSRSTGSGTHAPTKENKEAGGASEESSKGTGPDDSAGSKGSAALPASSEKKTEP